MTPRAAVATVCIGVGIGLLVYIGSGAILAGFAVGILVIGVIIAAYAVEH